MAVFTNQATLSYSGGVTNSNITTGELVESVSVVKTAVSASYNPGDHIAYVISIVNNGAAPLSGLTVTDDLGTYPFGSGTVTPLNYVEGSLLYFVGGVSQPASGLTVTAGPPLAVSGIDIPANSNATLIYEAAVTRFAPLGTGARIDNTASLTGGALTDLTASASVPMAGEVQLTISKSASAEQVSLNGELAYRFVIQNSGSEAAEEADAVVLTDTFDPVLSGLSVTWNGTAWSEPENYTYDQATGVFSTVSGQITVPGAAYVQSADGSWTVTPGVGVLTVTGTV